MRVIDSVIHRLLDRKARRLAGEFTRAANSPEETQWRLLQSILTREAGTGFGRDHGFGDIRSAADYRRRVPVAGYERMEPYINRVVAGEQTALFANQKIVMFALTSGTSAARKLIPVTRRNVETHRRGWLLWGLSAYDNRLDLLFRGKINFNGDDAEFRTPAGAPCGSISGLTARMQSPFVRRTYVLPLAASRLHDTRSKYYLAWRLGLGRDVASWMSPNPSTHLALARFGDAAKESLIRDVRDGTYSHETELPAEVRKAVRRELRPNPGRAGELDRIVERTGHLFPKDVWPEFGLIGCWLGGPLTAYLKFFPEFFGETPRRDLGLVASEGRMTIPLADHTSAGALDLFGMFFEFIPVAEAGSAAPIVLPPHELQEGHDYYILLTTTGGLYRYDIQDVVRCVGWQGRSPLIEFLNKGKHVSNITGEKISEHQVSRAMEAACEKLALRVASYALAPCFEDEVPYYGLFVELDESLDDEIGRRLAGELDRQLCGANCEYEAKRDSGRLREVQLRPLRPGAWERFDRDRIARTGATAEQYKRPRLFVDLEFAGRIGD